MPLIDVQDLLDPESPAEQILAGFFDHVRAAAEASITRHGRVRKGAKRFARTVRVLLDPDEDPRDLCVALAKRLTKLAEDDAGDEKATYVAALLTESTDAKRPTVLASVRFTLNDDDDADDATTVKTATSLIRDIGERNLKLLDNSISMVERMMPLVAAHGSNTAEMTKAEAGFRLELKKLELDDRRQREAEANEAANVAMVCDTIKTVAAQYQNIITAFAEGFRAKWEGKRGAS